MNFKTKIYALLVTSILIIQPVFWNQITVVNTSQITTSQAFSFFADTYKNNIPETYKYISLDFSDLQSNQDFYEDLQILVYVDKIKNTNQKISPNKELNKYVFYKLAENILGVSFDSKSTKQELLDQKATQYDIQKIKKLIANQQIKIESLDVSGKNNEIRIKKAIFNDVFQTISKKHYKKKDFTEAELLDSAIEWIAKWTKDKHTVYFPPVKSKSFSDTLAGEYEGIWAYVDMQEPGKMMIISPIPGSPAEKSGLKGGDQIIKVWEKTIDQSHSLNEVVSWIKGPEDSSVLLTILRKGKTLEIKVLRKKIIISNIEDKKLSSNTYYIQIKSFWSNVSQNFVESLQRVKEEKNTRKIIFDLRNNGGWYLGEVTEMLSHLIKKWEKTAVVKYLDKENSFISKGYETLNLDDYKIIILQNGGSASASEIFIGTLNDYYPDIITIWEKSYGKGSVQTIKSYKDGSSLKFTIAKWFTGKTQTGIDAIGIEPDVELEYDFEKYQKSQIDNQLEKAKRY